MGIFYDVTYCIHINMLIEKRKQQYHIKTNSFHQNTNDTGSDMVLLNRWIWNKKKINKILLLLLFWFDFRKQCSLKYNMFIDTLIKQQLKWSHIDGHVRLKNNTRTNWHTNTLTCAHSYTNTRRRAKTKRGLE